jgi:hypothetical protein
MVIEPAGLRNLVLLAGLLGAASAPVQPARAQPAIRCDGVTDAAPAINAAIEAAAAGVTGGVVTLPLGVCRVDLSAGRILPASRVTLRGQGRGRTVVLADDTRGNSGTWSGRGAISNGVPPGTPGVVPVPTGGNYRRLTDFHLRDLTVKGLRDDHAIPAGFQNAGFLVNLVSVENVSVRDCEFLDSRAFSLAIAHGSGVSVQDNLVSRSSRDSIAVWDVSDAVITGNHIRFSGDDAISAHSSDATPSPVRSGLVIADNVITDSQGIAVLGAKSVSITGNVLRRVAIHGVFVSATTQTQGATPTFAVNIANNIITDVYDISPWRRGSFTKDYIRVGGPQRMAAARQDSLYANDMPFAGTDGTRAGRGVAPGNFWVRIEGNTLVRTLLAVEHWSDWGYGAVLDTYEGISYNGPMTDAMLAARAIWIEGGLSQSRVAGNIIRTGGPRAIEFSGIGLADMAYDGLVITDNQISGFTQAGVFMGRSGTQRIRIDRNEFEADPALRPMPAAIVMPGVRGITAAANGLRNVAGE